MRLYLYQIYYQPTGNAHVYLHIIKCDKLEYFANHKITYYKVTLNCTVYSVQCTVYPVLCCVFRCDDHNPHPPAPQVADRGTAPRYVGSCE